jgi:hypothetical protein
MRHHHHECTCRACEAHDDRVITGLVLAMATIFALLLWSMACTPAQRATVGPSLGEVVRRVDVGRLLECAGRSGWERARCLGAAVLSPALDLAVDRAAGLAERAQQAMTPGAGADDVDPDALAAELDAALADVAREIAATEGGAR